MKRSCWKACGVVLIVVMTAGMLRSEPLEAHPDTSGEGWVKLYNGKDLTGWRTEGNWVPQPDGVLAIKPRKGERGWKRYKDYLWTEKKYKDFVIDLEYKLPKNGNSGLHFRIKDKDPVKGGIEIQIKDSHGKPDKKMTAHDNGGIIKTSAPKKNASKPAGEWNRLTVSVKGYHLQAVLNGVRIQDVQLDKGPVKDRPLEGYIALQDHGLPLWFRNIKIKELK